MMVAIQSFLEQLRDRHSHLCPRQVLGVRIGRAGASALGLEVPRADKRLLVIVETDGCFVSGVEVATRCSISHRTLRVEDYGKVAATFVDVTTGQALRVAPRLDVRQRAHDYAPGETRRYFAQMHGYQIMPDEELLSIERVQLNVPVNDLVSRPGIRANCEVCGEEIINQREIEIGNQILCRMCAGLGYYQPFGETTLLAAYPYSEMEQPCQPLARSQSTTSSMKLTHNP